MKDRERLYDMIDREEGLSDEEKREYYFSAIADEEAEREWEDSQ